MPLFNDPFWDNILLNGPRAVQADAGQQAEIKQPFGDQEEQDSALRRLLGGGATALQYVGDTLDKPARTIRAGLSLLTDRPRPRELLSALPFSDTLGITDPSEKVHGADLLESFGLVGPAVKGEFQARDVAGPVVEALLDPLTYATFGGRAINSLGQQAKRIGALPERMAGRIGGHRSVEDIAKMMGRSVPEATDIARTVGVNIEDLVGKPLGGLMGLGGPLGLGEQTVFGTGEKSLRLAEKLGSVGDAIRWSGPGRYANAMFNGDVWGQPGELAQRNLLAGKAADKARRVQSRMDLLHVAEPLHNVGALDQTTRDGLLHAIAEGRPIPAGLPPELEGALRESANRYNSLTERRLADLQSAGLRVADFDSVYGTKYVARGATPKPDDPMFRRFGSAANFQEMPKEFKSRQFSTFMGQGMQRDPLLDLPEGIATLRKIEEDPRVFTRARKPLDAAGNAVPDLVANDATVNKLAGAFDKFTPEQGRRLVELRGTQPLSSADAAELEALTGLYRRSNRDVMRVVLEDILKAQPGSVMATRPFGKSELRQLIAQRQAGPLAPDQAARLDQLQELYDQAKFLAGRLYSMRQGQRAGGFADVAREVLPALNTAWQDRAAERVLRKDYLGNNPAELRKILTDAGIAPADINRADYRGLVKQLQTAAFARGSERPDILANFGLPGDVGNKAMQLAFAEWQAPRLAKYLGTLDPRRLRLENGERGVGLLANDMLVDLLHNVGEGDRAVSRANAAFGMMADAAKITRTPEPGSVSARQIMRELGLSSTVGRDRLVSMLNERGATLGPRDINKVFVPADAAREMRGLVPRVNLPEYLQGPKSFIDNVTSLFKASVTSPYPSFHVRNLASSFWANLMGDSPGAATFGAKVMSDMRRGVATPGLAAAIPQLGMTSDQEAMKKIGELMFAHKAAGRSLSPRSLDEGAGAMASAAKSVYPQVPGMVPAKSFGGIVKDYVPKSLAEANPLAVQGVLGQTSNRFAPVRAGQEMGDLVDDLARGGMFVDLLKQNYAPNAAADLTTKYHYDYSDLTGFERGLRRYLLPFYTWMRKTTPLIAEDLMTRPGGLNAQAIRVGNDLRQEGGFLPSHLGGGMAIPIGNEDNGTRRYLTKTDLPYENPLEMINVGPGGASKTAMKLLGQLNPLIKGPLEMATNRQFYSGRELNELYSRTGMPTAEQIAYNLPYLSKLITTYGNLTDERKGALPTLLNLGTGLRVADVDMNAQRAAAKSSVRDLLQQHPDVFRTFEDVTVRPEAIGNLTPEELLTMRLYRALDREQKQAAQAAHAR